jgi:ABC-type multidrug transport system fused ATPase/permease subunit
MIDFTRKLWPILTRRARVRLGIAAIGMAFVALLEGLGLLLMVPLLQLLTSPDFSATSMPIRAAERVTGSYGGHLTGTLAVAVFVLYLVKGLTALGILRWSARVVMEEEANLVGRLLRIYLGSPMSVHFTANTAEFQRTVNQAVRVLFAQAVVAAFSAFADVLSVGMVALILVASDPALSLIGAGYFGVVIVVYQRFVQRAIARASLQVHDEQADVFREVQQSLAAVREIKASAAEQHFTNIVTDSRTRMLDAYRTIALTNVQPRYVLELAMVGAAGVVAGFAYSTRSASVATASMAIFLAGGFRMLAPLNKVFNGINQARTAMPAIEQIVHDIDVLGPLAEAELFEPPIISDLRPNISMRSVTFRYRGSTDVLVGVDLDVHDGEAVAIVGGSGAGKSTIVDLLLGLLSPDHGSITVDGHSLDQVRRQWQRMVGYVPQSISLLDASVRENITFGLGVNDDDRLWQVLDAAQLRDVVESLPSGLETRIGERGTLLSGGQRQRLGIARALYRSPAVLVLDEATSALDNETEARLTQVLEKLRGTLTTVTIAHRLSTVRHADRAYFVDSGRVLAAGTFDELHRSVPGFARLVELASVGPAAHTVS